MGYVIKIVLSFAFSGFFLFLAFQNIELGSLWDSLGSVSWIVFLSVSAMAIMSMFLRAWRWRILLRPVKDIPFNSVFTYTMIGFMANNVLPAHAGDVVKPYLLGMREKVSGFAALATVIVERLLDGIGLIVIFLVVLPFAPLPDSIRLGGVVIGGALVFLLGLLMILSAEDGRLRNRIISLAEKLPNRFRAKVLKHLEMFLFGLTIFQDRRNLLPLLGISVFVWAHLALTIFMILKGYPLEAEVANIDLLIASVVTIVVLAFAIVLPSSPGYIGITQMAFIFALGHFGILDADAVGVSVIFNLTQYIPVTLGGVVYLLREGLSFKQIRQEARQHG